MKHHT